MGRPYRRASAPDVILWRLLLVARCLTVVAAKVDVRTDVEGGAMNRSNGGNGVPLMCTVPGPAFGASSLGRARFARV